MNRNLSFLRTLGSTAVRATGEAIRKKMTGSAQGDELWNVSSQAAMRLVKGLDELKGAAMKMGQLLSLEKDLLPPAWQAALGTLQSSSTPRDFSEMKPLLEKSLGGLDAFASIDPVAVHAASMAQVHKGILRETGQPVAIKIRYPGLRESVATDLKNISRILKLAGVIQQEDEAAKIMAKVRDVFDQELDFVQEMEKTEEFARLLKHEPHLVTAEPIRDLCREDVLTTTWLNGRSVEAWLREFEPDDAERTRVSTLLVRSTLLEIFRFRHLQSDPNPGNFLVLDNGKLGLIDFGAAVILPEAFVRDYRELALAAHEGDDDKLEDSAEAVGFLQPGDSREARDCFIRLMDCTAQPFLHVDFDWTDAGLASSIKNESLRFAKLLKFRFPPEEFVFLNRRIYGTELLLEKVGGRVPARELFEEIVRGRSH